MIREDLLEFKYYLNRLSKFMQESYGISEQMETFFSLLKQVDSFYDEFFKEINLWKNSYENNNPLLDMLGNIFGCRRSFTIPVYSSFYNISGYQSVNLNDSDFLFYIKTQIVKQNFNGTRENLQQLYSTFINGQIQQGITNITFIYYTDPTDPATCSIYWNVDPESDNYSEDLKKLFYGGYLTIESLGITYQRAILNIDEIATFISESQQRFSTFNYFKYTGTAYRLTIGEPSDWPGSDKYFSLQESPRSTNTYSTDTFFRKDGINMYVKIINDLQPADWVSNPSVYVELTPTEATAGDTWTANTWWEKITELGGKMA